MLERGMVKRTLRSSALPEPNLPSKGSIAGGGLLRLPRHLNLSKESKWKRKRFKNSLSGWLWWRFSWSLPASYSFWSANLTSKGFKLLEKISIDFSSL